MNCIPCYKSSLLRAAESKGFIRATENLQQMTIDIYKFNPPNIQLSDRENLMKQDLGDHCLTGQGEKKKNELITLHWVLCNGGPVKNGDV